MLSPVQAKASTLQAKDAAEPNVQMRGEDHDDEMSDDKETEEYERGDERWSDPGLKKFEALEAEYVAMGGTPEDFDRRTLSAWLGRFTALIRRRRWPRVTSHDDAMLLLSHLEWEQGWIRQGKIFWKSAASPNPRDRSHSKKRQPKRFCRKIAGGFEKCENLYKGHIKRAYKALGRNPHQH
jgi:hypothetical protein